MTFSIRRALGVAVVATAAGVAQLTAQGSPPPQVTVGGVVYTQYVYQLKDTVNHVNTFDITRAYVNVLGKFSGGVGTRVTADSGFMTTTGGQSNYISAADFGVGVDGKWGPDKINFQLTVVNGEFYKSGGTGQGKDVMGRVSVRVMDTDDSSRVGGLRVTAYTQYGKPTGGGERNRFLGMVSYRTKQITLAGEAAATQDGPLGSQAGHVYSAFGVYKFPRSKAAVLARVDVADPQAGADDRQTRVIAGASYQLSPNWRLLGDWDYVSLQGTPTVAQDAVRSQALFQTQFTF